MTHSLTKIIDGLNSVEALVDSNLQTQLQLDAVNIPKYTVDSSGNMTGFYESNGISVPFGSVRNVATNCSTSHAAFNGGVFQQMSRSSHVCTSNVTSVKILLPNWRAAAGAETAPGSTATMKVAIEKLDGTLAPATYGGVSSMVVPDGGFITTDAITVTLGRGERFYVRVWRSSTSGILYGVPALNTITPADSRYKTSSAGIVTGERFNYGVTTADLTASTGTFTNAGNFMYRPAAIVGWSRYPAVADFGDSKSIGTNDVVSDFSSFLGNTGRALAGKVAFCLFGVGGETLYNLTSNTNAATSMTQRLQMMQYFTHVFMNMGTNDIHGSTRTDVQFLTDLATFVGLFPNQRVYAMTVPCRASSTDNFATLAGQTPFNTGSSFTTQKSVNDALRTASAVSTGTGAQKVAGVFDYNDANASSRNSGIFKVWPNGRNVTDAAIDIGVSTTTLNSATAAFTAADLGLEVVVAGAGAAGAVLTTGITAIVSATAVTISVAAGTTVSGATANIGTHRSASDGIHESPSGYIDQALSGYIDITKL